MYQTLGGVNALERVKDSGIGEWADIDVDECRVMSGRLKVGCRVMSGNV
jgi:hypothetical protein